MGKGKTGHKAQDSRPSSRNGLEAGARRARPLKTSPMRRLEKTLTIGNLWLCIMSILGHGRIYAYFLPERIKKTFGFSPSRLMCYLVLYRLEAESLIESEFVGRRKYYSATAKGRHALSEAKRYLKRTGAKL